MQEREIHKIYNTRAAEKQDDFDYFFFFDFHQAPRNTGTSQNLPIFEKREV